MKKLFKNTLFVALFAILLTGAGIQAKEVNAASLNKTSVTMVKDTGYTLKASGKVKKATSSNESIVKIKKTSGQKVRLRAKKKGTATVKVKVGSKTLKCRVTVVKASLNKTSVTKKISKGGTGKVTLKVTGKKPSKWKSSNTKVATVSGSGKNCTVKIKKKGTVTITATVGQSKLKCKIKGKYKPEEYWTSISDTGILVLNPDASVLYNLQYQTASSSKIKKALLCVPEFKKFNDKYLSAKMTDAEKISAMIRFLRDTGWIYGDPNSHNKYLPSGESQKAESLLKYGKAVCAGWSEMIMHLCFVAEIPCFEVHSSSEGHRWNYIQLDGYWYSADFCPSEGEKCRSYVALKGKNSSISLPLDTEPYEPANLEQYAVYKRWVSKLPTLRKLSGLGYRCIGFYNFGYWVDENGNSHDYFSDWN